MLSAHSHRSFTGPRRRYCQCSLPVCTLKCLEGSEDPPNEGPSSASCMHHGLQHPGATGGLIEGVCVQPLEFLKTR